MYSSSSSRIPVACEPLFRSREITISVTLSIITLIVSLAEYSRQGPQGAPTPILEAEIPTRGPLRAGTPAPPSVRERQRHNQVKALLCFVVACLSVQSSTKSKSNLDQNSRIESTWSLTLTLTLSLISIPTLVPIVPQKNYYPDSKRGARKIGEDKGPKSPKKGASTIG